MTPLHVLPEQTDGGLRRSFAFAPARQLMVAVLEDAVRSYQKLQSLQGRAGRKYRDELEAWFASDDAEWIFSFHNVCDVLGLDAPSIRHALRVPDRAPNALDAASRKVDRRRRSVSLLRARARRGIAAQ